MRENFFFHICFLHFVPKILFGYINKEDYAKWILIHSFILYSISFVVSLLVIYLNGKESPNILGM